MVPSCLNLTRPKPEVLLLLRSSGEATGLATALTVKRLPKASVKLPVAADGVWLEALDLGGYHLTGQELRRVSGRKPYPASSYLLKPYFRLAGGPPLPAK
jgi:hypothetical protein